MIEILITKMKAVIDKAMTDYERDDIKLVCKLAFIEERKGAFWAYYDVLYALDKEKALEILRENQSNLNKLNSVYWKALILKGV